MQFGGVFGVEKLKLWNGKIIFDTNGAILYSPRTTSRTGWLVKAS